MKNYITIDGGTSNTRVHLVQNGEVMRSEKFGMGAKEDSAKIWTAIEERIGKICDEYNLNKRDITAILVSGMITREYEHIKAPVGASEIKASMHKSEIMGIPAYFIRGVKTESDMMRGEETELYGIGGLNKGVYILPGSHTKLIAVDDSGRISDVKTMLTGEMLEVLSKYTILKETVDITINDIDRNCLIEGYNCCKENGINHALFKTRVISVLENRTKAEACSFYTGVILCGEIAEIVRMKPKGLTIAGKPELAVPMELLIEYAVGCEIRKIADASTLSALGAVRIFEFCE